MSVGHPISRDQWLQERRSMIGGSDAPDVLEVEGVGYRGRLAVYAAKRGQSEPVEETEAMRWGRRSEQMIADAVAEELNLDLQDPGDYTIVRNDTWPWMGCTLDRVIRSDASGRRDGALEIKTAGWHQAKAWDDGPPMRVQVQVQHQLAVTGYGWGIIACLLAGQELRTFEVEAHDRFLAAMVDREADFWRRYVEGNVEPPPGRTPADADALRILHPIDDGQRVALPEEMAELAARFDELKAAKKDVESELREIENEIKAALGDAAVGTLPDGSGFSWKTQTRKGYVVEPNTIRVFRRMSV